MWLSRAAALQECGGRGVCNVRATCECFFGYTGPDCTECDAALCFIPSAGGCVRDPMCNLLPAPPPLAPPPPARVIERLTYYKEFTEWTECSAACGGGTRSRELLRCVDSNGVEADIGACSSLM